MKTHTQGVAVATGNGIHIGIRCLALTYMDPFEQRVVDATRMAACWNACSGISTQMLIDLPDGLLSASVPYHELKAQNKELLADLREAAATLRRYETLHRAKGTADSDAKAEVNAALASRFEATIARATGSQA